MEAKKEDVKRALSEKSSILGERYELLAKNESDSKGYKDSLTSAIVAYSKEPTPENMEKLKSVIWKPDTDIDREGFLQEVLTRFSLERTPKAKPTKTKTPTPKSDLKPLSEDAKSVNDLAESMVSDGKGTPAIDRKSLKAIDEMVGKAGNPSELKKAWEMDGKIAKAFVNGGLTVYDLMTYSSTSRLWCALAAITVGTTFAISGAAALAVKTVVWDLGRLAVKTIGKIFKAQKGTAEKAYVKKYRDSIKRGTKTTDKLIEVLGKEKAEAYKVLEEMGEKVPEEIDIGADEPLNINAELREISATGLSTEEKRGRMESTEGKLDAAEKSQKGVIVYNLTDMRESRVTDDLAGLDIADLDPKEIDSFLKDARVDEEGKIIPPKNSAITQESLEELPPEARRRIAAVISMPKIESLSDEKLAKLGQSVTIRVDETTGEKSVVFDEAVLGDDDTLLKISRTFAENPDILPENAVELAEGVITGRENIEAVRAARRAVIADHKLDVAQHIRRQFESVREMSAEYTRKGRASEDGLSKTEKASRKTIRSIAMAKVQKMSRKKLTDIIRAGDDSEKSIHEQAEQILLKDLLTVENTKSRTLENQEKILHDEPDQEEDMEII